MKWSIKIIVALSVSPATAAAESRNEHCQKELIVTNCVMNHSSEAEQLACARKGDPNTSPLERSRWCSDHGYDWSPWDKK